MLTTYKDLYTQVIEEIEKRSQYPIADAESEQLSKSQLSSIAPSTGFGGVDSGEILNSVSQLLDDIVPPRIKSGLTIEATSPETGQIIVKAGIGIIGGKIYTLKKDVTMSIPFDVDTYVYFITLYVDGVEIERNSSPTKLSLGKIIVPEPGTTDRIYDKRNEETLDAYIINFGNAVLHVDAFGNFEEDAIDMLKEAIGDILGDNIIGNITINENLKIINTAGTVEIDSNSLKIYTEAEQLMAKFNRDGVFFYNTSGVVLSKFGRDEAYIGNIQILPNAFQAKNFVSGSAGFRILDTGNVEFNDAIFRGTIYATAGEIGGLTITNNSIESSDFVSGTLGSGFRIKSDVAEFNNIIARGKITTSVFVKETISAVGGNLLVTDADVLDADMTTTQTTLTISGDTTFAVGDILRIKDGTDDEWMEVIGISSAPTYDVTRDRSDSYSSGFTSPAWKKGTAVVNFKQANDGGVFISSSEPNSPYLDFFVHNGYPWTGTTSKTRIGKLDGIAGASGYGIWGGDGYLGALEVIDTISISSTGTIRSNLTGSYPYLEFSQSGLQLKDSDQGGTYGTAVYTSGGDKYGFGALAWLLNSDIKIPLAILKEPNAGASDVADIRLFNRGDDPGGAAEVGDLACVGGKLKLCTGAGTPGTWTICGTQS